MLLQVERKSAANGVSSRSHEKEEGFRWYANLVVDAVKS